MSKPLDKQFDSKAEGITWISPQSLIQLRLHASQTMLNSSIIHAKQGGAYLSSFKGRGMEFDESRIYQAGDDIRNMDWRVTARTGDAHTKVFREERERPVLLWLDLNPSMMFATRNRFKSVIATELAALIAWGAAKNNDRLGGLIFSSDEHIEIKPRRGKAAVLDFIGRCAKHTAWRNSQPASPSERNMMAAVSRLRKVTHPGSLIFMISDFRGLDDKCYSHIANIARHNDIVMIKIHDPIEAELPVSGDYRLSDGINELQIHTADKKLRDEYHRRYMDKEDQLKTFCRQYRIHLIEMSTADDHLDKLNKGLGVRVNKKQQFRSA
ncbi:MAG: DUF58 domain-containing protein [Gammaproteobacteria bacterium]|jgi:uncharacterized protein (DUF58 family)|nr:DUF58 domain-containing protein [Gammaproteobacteria bacterium]